MRDERGDRRGAKPPFQGAYAALDRAYPNAMREGDLVLRAAGGEAGDDGTI